MGNTLYQITAPHFIAGILVDNRDSKVYASAPIIRYMVGWNVDKVKSYCETKKWKCKVVRA